jgi:hypothetical protein
MNTLDNDIEIDAERYNWLATYLVSERSDMHDKIANAIMVSTTELSRVIDEAMETETIESVFEGSETILFGGRFVGEVFSDRGHWNFLHYGYDRVVSNFDTKEEAIGSLLKHEQEINPPAFEPYGYPEDNEAGA